MATEITDFSTTAASNTANWPENQAPSTVNNAGREDEAILAKWYGDVNGSLASGGSSNAYTLTLNRTKFEVTSAFDGFPISFQANHANTGAATLNVTPSGGAAKGAKAIVRNFNTALVTGDIVAGQVVSVIYDNSLDKFQLVSPTPLSGALENVVEDTTPQLGGDLDLNGNNIDFPTTANISDCLDEDDMATDSATALATQQSIKAYVDTQIAAITLPSADFTSTEQTITLTSTVDVAHSLGAIPTLTQVFLRNKTTEFGYSVNDEILLSGDNAATGAEGFTVVRDATNVSIVIGSQIEIHRRDTAASVALTAGNWRIVVKAWS